MNPYDSLTFLILCRFVGIHLACNNEEKERNYLSPFLRVGIIVGINLA